MQQAEGQQPMQGLNIHVKTPSRIKISLVKADDGPGRSPEAGRGGWRKSSLSER